MTDHTRRFGLNKFGGAVGGTIGDEGQKFSTRDRDSIDAILAAFEGALGGADALAGPTTGPVLTLATTGGELPAGSDIYYRVSFLDGYGLETEASDEVSVSTPDPILEPTAPALTGTSGGALAPGTYYYGLSFIQADGAETMISPLGSITRTSTGSVTLQLPALPSGATAVRIYRQGPNDSDLFKLSDQTGSSYVDTGSASTSATPALENTTNSKNKVTVDVPDASIVGADPSAVKGWRIYRTFTPGDYGSASLVHEVVETENQTPPYGPLVTTWEDTGTSLLDGAPLDVSTTLKPPTGVSGGGGGGAVAYGRFLPEDTTVPAVDYLPIGTAQGSQDGTPVGQVDQGGTSREFTPLAPYNGIPANGGSTPFTGQAWTLGKLSHVGAETLDATPTYRLDFALLDSSKTHRVDVVYQAPNFASAAPQYLSNTGRQLIYAYADCYDATDHRSFPNQFAGNDPDGYTDDISDFAVLWADDTLDNTSWRAASFTVPAGAQHVYLSQMAFSGYLNGSSDPDEEQGFKIAYLRVTVVADGDADGELFVEHPSKAIWLYDRSNDPDTGQDGQGWYLIRRPTVMTGHFREVVTGNGDKIHLSYGSDLFVNPKDAAGNRLGLARADVVPISFYAAIPPTTAGSVTTYPMGIMPVAASVAQAPDKTQQGVVPFLMPDALAYDTARLEFGAFSVTASEPVTTGSLTVKGRATGRAGAVDPLNDFDLLQFFQFTIGQYYGETGVAGAFYNADYLVARTRALKAYDRVRCQIATSTDFASTSTIFVVCTVYLQPREQ